MKDAGSFFKNVKGSDDSFKNVETVVKGVAPVAEDVAKAVKREVMELLARQVASGAFSVSDPAKDAGKVLQTVGPIAGAVIPLFFKREEMELLARAADRVSCYYLLFEQLRIG